jgi:hypothetical protein
MAGLLSNTKFQFVFAVFVTIVAVAWLANSPAGNVFGKQAVGLLGLALVLVIVFVFSGIFWKASAGKRKSEKDVVEEIPSGADPRAVSKLVEIKYAERGGGGGPSFEEMYGIARKKKR